MSHTIEDLKELQSKSLEEKIQLSTARIIEWYENWGGQVYISNSGGVDSTVLSDLVHRVYPEVPDVYCDTGLEYPELREFIMSKPNVVVLKPGVYNRHTRKYDPISFIQVIQKYGYPLISKEVSQKVNGCRTLPNGYDSKRFDPNSEISKKYPQYCIAKYKFLTEADFYIGAKCCDAMKKRPFKHYEKQTNRHPYIGTMTEESQLRKQRWLKYGCNAFEEKRAISTPLAFWSKSDVLEYLVKYNLSYCSVYGEIKRDKKDKYYTTGCYRTGCVFCAYGVHLQKELNKFQTLAKTHPQLYDFCMRGGKYDENGMWQPDKGLGMAKVLDFINVKWWNDGDEAKRDEYRAKYKEKEEAQALIKKQNTEEAIE
jgi:3'-phosphoadenosine 5'-phosphosulfate sulfotransferase (PAPS reductase)/FAD synthetase